MVVLRGGWRNPRGLLAFVLPALLVAVPWYAVHWAELRATGDWARSGNTTGTLWSAENLSWYAWSALNLHYMLPLTAFAAVGGAVSAWRFSRTRRSDDYTPELLSGLLVGWAALTFYLHLKSPYYALPLTVYAALLATGWIASLRPGARRAATVALVAVAAVNFAVAASWIGEPVRVSLPGASQDPGPVSARHVTLVSPSAWPGTLPPGEHGDVLGLMRRLEARGIEVIEFDPGTDLGYFNPTGLTAFARIAGLSRPPAYDPAALRPPHDAFMGRQFITPDLPPPCVELGDGSGVFVTLGSPFDERRICPRSE